VTAYLAIPASLVGLYYMNRCYRIKARPFWDHWQVAASFFGAMLSLGALTSGLVAAATLILLGQDAQTLIFLCGITLVLGVLLESVGLISVSYTHLTLPTILRVFFSFVVVV